MQEIRNFETENEDTLHNLKSARDKFYAHIDLEWQKYAKSITFDEFERCIKFLNDLFRGKIKPLKDLNSFKALYKAERKSDDEIDAIAKPYEKLFEEIIKANDYNLILRHLDYKGLMTQLIHILKFSNNTAYEEGVFELFNTADGEELLINLRKEYFEDIIP